MRAATKPHGHPHRRHDALRDRWVLVSPQRLGRPWSGQEERAVAEVAPAHDPGCHLCPGNRRASGAVNPAYRSVYVFENDFPALVPEAHPMPLDASPLHRAEPVCGTCRVICFSPHHGATLPLLAPGSMRAVVDAWVQEDEALRRRFHWVQVFENRGATMGCSNPHPHGQVWAVDGLPTEGLVEERSQASHHRGHGAPLLGDYLDEELRRRERIVCANDDWVALVPFAAAWPYETLILPRRRTARLGELEPDRREALGALLRELLTRYDNLFLTHFPYCMGWHAAPGQEPAPHWTLHAHLYPPLLRSATVRKFMVGFEMLAEAQRDLTPEDAAGRLRSLSIRHFTRKGAA